MLLMLILYRKMEQKNKPEGCLFVVAGVGFEPTTFWLWARRATRLLYPATIGKFYIKLAFMSTKLAKPEIEPEFEIALFAGFRSGVFILFFGLFAVLWQDDHGFTLGHAVLLGASHVFLVFFGLEIFLLEFKSFDFDFEASFFDLALTETLLQNPVAVHGADGAGGPPDKGDQNDDKNDVRKSEEFILGLIAQLAEFGFDILHASIIPFMLT